MALVLCRRARSRIFDCRYFIAMWTVVGVLLLPAQVTRSEIEDEVPLLDETRAKINTRIVCGA